MVVLRLTAAPVMSRPVSVTGTPARPASPASGTPLWVLAGVAGLWSAKTLPDSEAGHSAKWLPAEPLAGRPVMVMALAAPLAPLVPALVPPSA